jgi:hypothetical protein
LRNIFRALIFLSPLCLYSLEGAIEGRGGYFYFANSTAREIYHQGAPDVELESFLLVSRYFTPWLNINYVWKEGQSEALSDRTDLKMGLFSFGSKILFPYLNSTVKGYIGVGLCGAYVHITDHSAYLPNKTIRWGGGVVGKSGMLIDIKWGIFLDLFFDYYYLPIKTRSSVSENFINLGGFRTGLGIGAHF